MSDPSIYKTWSEEETHLFLGKHRVGRMGTIDEGGFPHVIPMWHVLFEGMLYISTSSPRKKITNLLNNPNMSYTVDEGEEFNEYRGVLIQGRAEFVEDPELLRRYNIAWTYRHFGTEAHPYYQTLTQRKRRVWRLEPVRVLTWDYQGGSK